jgi:phosphonate transport system substrate-binding protein
MSFFTRREIMRVKLVAGLLAGVLGVTGAHAQEINFGVIATESSSNLRAIWQPFLDDMQKKTGLQVKAFFASDYAGVIEGMRFNKVQMAWYGNKSAMEAVDRANGQVFAQSVDKSGAAGYWSHIIVHRDSPIKSLDDLLKCDKTFDYGNGDPNSTSGFLVPMTFVFGAKKIDPKNCFKTVRSANHEANALAVANKLVHAASNNNENLERLKLTNAAKAAEIRVLWTSPLIPSDPLVWRKDLDPALKTKISDFIFSYGTSDEAEKKTLAALGWAPFRKSDDKQLLPIRQMELSRSIQRVEADDTIPADKKSADLVKMQADFDALTKQISASSN